jgi:hypothetical protein
MFGRAAGANGVWRELRGRSACRRAGAGYGAQLVRDPDRSPSSIALTARR